MGYGVGGEGGGVVSGSGDGVVGFVGREELDLDVFAVTLELCVF